MSNSNLICHHNGPVVTVQINRPASMNAINADTEKEITDTLEKLDNDDSVRVIILTGSEKVFSAGYDLDAQGGAAAQKTKADLMNFWWRRTNVHIYHHWKLMELSKPVIAMVRGWCLGAGFWYSLLADITIASSNAVFGQPEIRENQEANFIFSALVGWKNSHRYTLTGDHFDAEEALRIGVVNEVYPDDIVEEKTMALAKRIAMVPREAVQYNKAITVSGLEIMGLRSALSQGVWPSTIIQSGNDSKDLEELREIRKTQGVRASLKFRDDKFLPEPGGPRSKK